MIYRRIFLNSSTGGASGNFAEQVVDAFWKAFACKPRVEENDLGAGKKPRSSDEEVSVKTSRLKFLRFEGSNLSPAHPEIRVEKADIPD